LSSGGDGGIRPALRSRPGRGSGVPPALHSLPPPFESHIYKTKQPAMGGLLGSGGDGGIRTPGRCYPPTDFESFSHLTKIGPFCKGFWQFYPRQKPHYTRLFAFEALKNPHFSGMGSNR